MLKFNKNTELQIIDDITIYIESFIKEKDLRKFNIPHSVEKKKKQHTYRGLLLKTGIYANGGGNYLAFLKPCDTSLKNAHYPYVHIINDKHVQIGIHKERETQQDRIPKSKTELIIASLNKIIENKG